MSVDEDVDVVDVDPHVIGNLGWAGHLVDSLLSAQRGGRGVALPLSPRTAVHGLELSGGVDVLAPALTGGVIILHVSVRGMVLMVGMVVMVVMTLIMVMVLVVASVMTMRIMRMGMGMSTLLVMVFLMVSAMTLIMGGMSPIKVRFCTNLLQAGSRNNLSRLFRR